jgi:hypothetical protein
MIAPRLADLPWWTDSELHHNMWHSVDLCGGKHRLYRWTGPRPNPNGPYVLAVNFGNAVFLTDDPRATQEYYYTLDPIEAQCWVIKLTSEGNDADEGSGVDALPSEPR